MFIIHAGIKSLTSPYSLTRSSASYITPLLQNSSEYHHPIQSHDLPMAVPSKQGWFLFESHHKALLKDSSTSISKLEKFIKVYIHTLCQASSQIQKNTHHHIPSPHLKDVNHTFPARSRSLNRPTISHFRRRPRPRVSIPHSRFLTPIPLHLRPTHPRLPSLGTSLDDPLHSHSRSCHTALPLSHSCIPQIRGV